VLEKHGITADTALRLVPDQAEKEIQHEV